jgi:hypothetical protein
VSKPHRGQGSRTAKYPILIYGDEAGFAELMPEQQEWMMKGLGTFAEAEVAQERQDPRGRRGRRLVVHSDGHLGPHDAAGEQTTTDGPFMRIKGDDAGAPLAWFRAAGRVQQSLW